MKFKCLLNSHLDKETSFKITWSCTVTQFHILIIFLKHKTTRKKSFHEEKKKLNQTEKTRSLVKRVRNFLAYWMKYDERFLNEMFLGIEEGFEGGGKGSAREMIRKIQSFNSFNNKTASGRKSSDWTSISPSTSPFASLLPLKQWIVEMRSEIA